MRKIPLGAARLAKVPIPADILEDERICTRWTTSPTLSS